jgi:hypothetical protein
MVAKEIFKTFLLQIINKFGNKIVRTTLYNHLQIRKGVR